MSEKNAYSGRFWGWDDGSVLFVRDADQDKFWDGPHVHRLQDHPALMTQIIALCERYFDPAASTTREEEQG